MAVELDVLPGGMVLARLPAIGTNKRLPKFWADDDARRMVVKLHRTVEIEEARKRIRVVLGDARTPSKSALQRAWARIDVAIKQSRVSAVRSAR